MKYGVHPTEIKHIKGIDGFLSNLDKANFSGKTGLENQLKVMNQHIGFDNVIEVERGIYRSDGQLAGSIDAIVKRDGLVDLVEIKTASSSGLRRGLKEQLPVFSQHAAAHPKEFTGKKMLVIKGEVKPALRPNIERDAAETGFEVVYLP